MSPSGRTGVASLLLLCCALFAVPASAGSPRDSAVGSGTNTFPTGGPAKISFSAHSDASGLRPDGFFVAGGDLDGGGPGEPFRMRGEVTCLRVSGNRAAIKYRFRSAEGSTAPFEGGGVQVFVEDNGPPRGGTPTDASAFDPPQPAGVFEADAARCDDPTGRLYDPIDSGNFVVRDALTP